MKRILIVEDNIEIAELERDYLEASDMEVEIVTDGEQGLARALQEDYDLLLLDVMLPHVSGYDICRRVRQSKQTPILMVSAKGEDIDKVRGLGLGADDYISKPFSPLELVARVKAHIARHETLTGAGKSEALSFGSLRIDKQAHRVTLDECEVQLANKEYELLLFLAEHPGVVFSREQLFDRVWGMDALSDTATVMVHIGRIREKLEATGNPAHFIETVRGAGYRFSSSV